MEYSQQGLVGFILWKFTILNGQAPNGTESYTTGTDPQTLWGCKTGLGLGFP